MATFKKSRAEMILSAGEKSLMAQAMDTQIRSASDQRVANFTRNAAMKKKLRSPLLKSLNREIGDLETIYQPARSVYDAERARLLKQKLAAKPSGRSKKIVRPNAVFGSTWGFDAPHYDWSWEYHRPTPGNPVDLFTADPTNGELNCLVRNGGVGTAESAAGVMFWYVPNKAGTLNIAIAPAMQEWLAAGAWYDEGNASAYITLGIQRWARQPFVYVDWAARQSDSLDALSTGWHDIQTMDYAWDLYSMQVSCPLDTNYYYAVWAYINALTYATGDGFGVSSLKAKIDGFAYWVS